MKSDLRVVSYETFYSCDKMLMATATALKGMCGCERQYIVMTTKIMNS
jgi:hypothetical protein